MCVHVCTCVCACTTVKIDNLVHFFHFQRSFFRNFLMYGFHFLVYILCVKGIKDTQVWHKQCLVFSQLPLAIHLCIVPCDVSVPFVTHTSIHTGDVYPLCDCVLIHCQSACASSYSSTCWDGVRRCWVCLIKVWGASVCSLLTGAVWLQAVH